MGIEFSEDPRVSFAVYVLQGLLELQQENPSTDFLDITSHKESVLERYGPIFHPDHVGDLTQSDFESFLLYKNNHHWDSLHRVGKFMTEDMGILREALSLLVDENLAIAERLNRIRPERYWGEHSMVSHLGTPVLTAILQVVYPDRYGVWNNTSDRGLKKVRLWKKQWKTDSVGESYMDMNALFNYLSQELDTDLWTLDALWWVMKK